MKNVGKLTDWVGSDEGIISNKQIYVQTDTKACEGI